METSTVVIGLIFFFYETMIKTEQTDNQHTKGCYNAYFANDCITLASMNRALHYQKRAGLPWWSKNILNNNILRSVGQGFNLLTATSLARSSCLWEQRWWGQGIYFLSHHKSAVILAYLDPSEFSSHMASAFKCSALSSSALRSSARDIARPRIAGRHSEPEPRSPLRPAGEKADVREWLQIFPLCSVWQVIMWCLYCGLFIFYKCYIHIICIIDMYCFCIMYFLTCSCCSIYTGCPWNVKAETYSFKGFSSFLCIVLL